MKIITVGAEWKMGKRDFIKSAFIGIKISLTGIIINMIFFSPFSLYASVTNLNPWSFRADFYKMPIYEGHQKKALLKETLNWMVPQVALNYPAEVTDREGNKTVYHNRKKKYSISIDGLITFSLNNVDVHSEKKLDSGAFHLYRTYERKMVHQTGERDTYGERVIYNLYAKNEFGEVINYEKHGLHNRLLEIRDAFYRPLSTIEYDQKNWDYTWRSGRWDYDFVNNIWQRSEEFDGKILPVIERRNSKIGDDGYDIARWERTSFSGKYGVWRIEKGWDGEYVVDMFYTLYNEFGKRPTETRHKNGYLVKEIIRQGGTTIEKETTKFTYRGSRYLDPRNDGEIWNDDLVSRWEYTYAGLKRLNTIQRYYKIPFYEEIQFDLAENRDRVVRRDNITGEIVGYLEDRVYFSEVKDMSADDLKKFLDIKDGKGRKDKEDEIAESLYTWIQEMKMQGKADASLFGIVDLRKETITLHDRDNLAHAEFFLKPDWDY